MPNRVVPDSINLLIDAIVIHGNIIYRDFFDLSCLLASIPRLVFSKQSYIWNEIMFNIRANQLTQYNILEGESCYDGLESHILSNQPNIIIDYSMDPRIPHVIEMICFELKISIPYISSFNKTKNSDNNNAFPFFDSCLMLTKHTSKSRGNSL